MLLMKIYILHVSAFQLETCTLCTRNMYPLHYRICIYTAYTLQDQRLYRLYSVELTSIQPILCRTCFYTNDQRLMRLNFQRPENQHCYGFYNALPLRLNSQSESPGGWSSVAAAPEPTFHYATEAYVVAAITGSKLS